MTLGSWVQETLAPEALKKASGYLSVGDPLFHLAGWMDQAAIMRVNLGKFAEIYPAFGVRQTHIPEHLHKSDVISILLNANSLSGGSDKKPLTTDMVKKQEKTVVDQINKFVEALRTGCELKSLKAELCYFPCSQNPNESKFLMLLYCEHEDQTKLFDNVLPQLKELATQILASRQKDGFGGRSR